MPIYPTLTGEQIAALLRDAGCRIAVVSTRQQFDKLNAVRAQTQLERIVIMDSAGRRRAPSPSASCWPVPMRAERERDPVFDALVRSVEPTDLATLIYTSGTTGEPKGVMLTHGNIAANQNFAAADFYFQFDRRLHLVSAALAHHRARAGLRDVQSRRAGGLLLAVRQAAAGHARDPAHGHSSAFRASTRKFARRSSRSLRSRR